MKKGRIEVYNEKQWNALRIKLIATVIDQMNGCYHDAMRECGISEDRAEKIKLLSLAKLEKRGEKRED